ncbi:glycosyltransferase [Fusibacter paucivorans]|uniref:glycosyltransferase n=1 Tax=Fusibacter paucivorans TaxID=76009 RepID=UPI0031B82D99
MKTIHILFPVLNEEKRLERGVLTTQTYMESLLLTYPLWDFLLTIVDNGSTDQTQSIGETLAASHKKIQYLRIDTKGVGAAFRAGLAINTADVIGYMDVDLSTDITHLEDVLRAFDQSPTLMLLNGSRLSKASKMDGRKWYRALSSRGLVYLLKLFLSLKASDAICGFKFFKAEAAKRLAESSSDENGWFYLIEMLLRAERMQMHIDELPVRWEDDHQTTVHFFKQTANYLKHIFRLYIEFHFRSKF